VKFAAAFSVKMINFRHAYFSTFGRILPLPRRIPTILYGTTITLLKNIKKHVLSPSDSFKLKMHQNVVGCGFIPDPAVGWRGDTHSLCPSSLGFQCLKHSASLGMSEFCSRKAALFIVTHLALLPVNMLPRLHVIILTESFSLICVGLVT